MRVIMDKTMISFPLEDLPFDLQTVIAELIPITSKLCMRSEAKCLPPAAGCCRRRQEHVPAASALTAAA